MSTTYFAGVSTGLPAISGGSTVPDGFSTPTATQAPTPVLSVRPHATPHRAPKPDVTEWLRSTAAQSFQGRWVLLDDALDPIDADSSPSSLLDRHPEIRTPLVVFVDPANARLAV